MDWGSATDWLGFGLDLYSYDQQQDAQEESVKAVEQGYQQQNPFAPYQPMMASGLMNILSNPGMITQTPGYQFAYDQGLQSLFAKQAAGGNRFSGGALTEAMQYGQGLASQMWNSEVDRYAKMSGAMQPYTGGVQTGQNLSSLAQQDAFNQSYFWNDLFQNFSNTSAGQTSPANQGTGGGAGAGSSWLDPYGEDSVN